MCVCVCVHICLLESLGNNIYKVEIVLDHFPENRRY